MTVFVQIGPKSQCFKNLTPNFCLGVKTFLTLNWYFFNENQDRHGNQSNKIAFKFTLGLQSRLILTSRSKPKPTISRNQHNLKYDVLELSHLTMLLIYISYSLELLSPLVGWFNRHEKSAHRWPAALGWQQHSQRQHGRCNIIDLNEGPPTRNQGTEGPTISILYI